MPIVAGETISQWGRAAQRLLRQPRQAQVVFHRVAERFDAVRLERHPHLQGAEVAREFDPIVAQVDADRAALLVLQVRRQDAEGIAQMLELAYNRAARHHRLVQPLVRVYRQRVEPFDALQPLSALVGEDRRRAIRAVRV
jgi:hypothetical protein